MILKFLFDRIVALIGLLFLWPLLIVVAVLVKIKMPDGSVILRKSVWVKMVSCLLVINSVLWQ